MKTKAKKHGLTGQRKSEQTRRKMQAAANKRWATPGYRAKHSKIMKERWAAVHKAERFLRKQAKEGKIED